MTDKERIKIICNDARALTDNDNKMIRCHINIKHFDWLIEQSEQVQKLKEIKNNAINQIDVTQERNKRLEKRVQELEDVLNIDAPTYQRITEQNKRYREALELLNRVSASDMKDEQLTSSHFVLDITGDALREG